jgi:hypothetical protein
MDINCIINWELYHEMRGTPIRIRTEEQLEADFKFKMEQRLILAFCQPESHEKIYLHEHEKWDIINGKRYNDETINFKDDWDLLMYAVECIEGMGYISTIEKFNKLEIHRMWFNESETYAEFACGARGETKKETIYEAVLDFCKTYVEQYKDKIIKNGGKL